MTESGAVWDTASEGQRTSQVLDPSESIRSQSSPTRTRSTMSSPSSPPFRRSTVLRDFFLSPGCPLGGAFLYRNDNPVLRHTGRLTSPARLVWMVLGALLLVAIGT